MREEEGSLIVKQEETEQVEEDSMALSADRERKMVGEGKIAGLWRVSEAVLGDWDLLGLVSYVVGRFGLLMELELGSATVSVFFAE